MTSLRKQRARIHSIHWDACRRRLDSMVEDQFWDRMPAVGREFGSPDFDRLMEEDYRLGRGVFDPAVRQAFGVGSKPGDRRAGVAEAASGPAAMTASGWVLSFTAESADDNYRP